MTAAVTCTTTVRRQVPWRDCGNPAVAYVWMAGWEDCGARPVCGVHQTSYEQVGFTVEPIGPAAAS